MKYILKPFLLIVLSVVLAAGAGLLVLWPRPDRIFPGPIEPGDREIVWLYTPTHSGDWERFVAAVNAAGRRLQAAYPDLTVCVDDNTFPRYTTTTTPELALLVRGQSARLLFRWYKLTSNQKTHQWVETLLGSGRQPPLAIIGGSSSELAIKLAVSLREQVRQHTLAAAPLLFLAKATADRIQERDDSTDVAFNDLYKDRTYRFCFTNREIAEAVTQFIWSRKELRPDADPVYIAKWEDDAYSMDLTGRFCEALRMPLTARSTVREWAWLSGALTTGSYPLNLAAISRGAFREPIAEGIDYSVGGFDLPNRWESPAVNRIMDIKIQQYPAQRRPLLVLAAASSQPARRFLRGLVRAAPVEAQQFVVATGDALPFNTIYRDRRIAWPIQDLPFNLIAFFHRNPVDAQANMDVKPLSTVLSTTEHGLDSGTEDFLVYLDIVESLIQAAYRGDRVPTNGDELAQQLRAARWHDNRVTFRPEGVPLFDENGNRRTGTGEYIVWLRPILDGDRVQSQAVIEVWSWQSEQKPNSRWKLYRTVTVNYDELTEKR